MSAEERREESLQQQESVEQQQEEKERRQQEEDWLVERLERALRRGVVPPFLIDCITQDLLVDPVLAQDGYCYSRQSIMDWIEVSNAGGNALLSPVTRERMGEELVESVLLQRVLSRVSEACEVFRKTVSQCSLTFTAHQDDHHGNSCHTHRQIYSLCKLASIYEQIDNYLVLTLSEKHPNWRVPQLAVLGLTGVGKSTLLERLLLISVFPCRSSVHLDGKETLESEASNEKEGCSTFVPLHIKLRHVHKKLATAMPPIVMRVIDTNKKVQIGDAQMLASFDSAHMEISRVMRKLRHDDGPDSYSAKKDKVTNLLSAIRNRNLTNTSEQDVGMNRAIIVHIYSPLVPTLNIVDLPGLTPITSKESSHDVEASFSSTNYVDAPHRIDESRQRAPVKRSNSTNSIRTGSSRRSSHSDSSVGSHGGMPFQGNSFRKGSFNHRQTWQSVTSADRRLEILERYILSYPDSLYLLLSAPKFGKETNNNDLEILDPTLHEIMRHYELENRTIGVLACEQFSEKSTRVNDTSESIHGTASKDSTMTSVRNSLAAFMRDIYLPCGYCAVSLFKNSSCENNINNSSLDTLPIDYEVLRSDFQRLQQISDPSSGLSIMPRKFRYPYLLFNAQKEHLFWTKNIVPGDALNVSVNALVVLINHAYVNDLKETWIPLALLELFNEKVKLEDMNKDLGFPLPPKSCVKCPAIFYREFENPLLKSESLNPHYAFDLENHKSLNGIVEYERYSQTFINSLLSAVRKCMTYDQYIEQTRLIGVTLLNPFLDKLQKLHDNDDSNAMSSVLIENCLTAEVSINQAMINVRNKISIICEDLLTRLKGFWGQAVLHILARDDSSFKLQRFPQFLSFMQSFLEKNLNNVYDALPEKWNKLLDIFFTVPEEPSCHGELTLQYEFNSFESVCKVCWNGRKLGQLMLTCLVSQSHLVSFHVLQRNVYTCIEQFFRELEEKAECLLEDHSDQREELEKHTNTVETCIQRVLTVLHTSALAKNIDVLSEEQTSDCNSNESADLLNLKSSGLDIKALASNDFMPRHLRAGGFSALEVLYAGFTIPEIIQAGFPLLDDNLGGFTLDEIRHSPNKSALHAAIKQFVVEEHYSLVSLVKTGFKLNELKAAGYDVYKILTNTRSGDDESKLDTKSMAAKALASSFLEHQIEGDSVQSLLDDGIVDALMTMLNLDNRVSEDRVTEVKCSAANAIANLCKAVALIVIRKENSIDHASDGFLSDLDDNSDNESSPDAAVDTVIDYLVDHGIVELLMKMYHSCHKERKAAAENALCAFCVTESAMHALATAGAIEPLVEQILNGSAEQRGWAAQALCRFSSERDQATASAVLSVQSDCISGLIECLEHEEFRFREAAAKALNNLAGDDADMRFIASKGALHVLVRSLKPTQYVALDNFHLSTDFGRCVTAFALTLRNLASSEKNASIIFTKTPAISNLVGLLGAKIDLDDGKTINQVGEWDVAEAAASALGGIAFCKEAKLTIAETEKAVAKLVFLIMNGNDSCCEAALWVIGCLACEIETLSTLIKSEVMESLVTTLRRQNRDGKRSYRCLTATAWCLRYLSTHLNSDVCPLLAESFVPAIPLLIDLLSLPSSKKEADISQVALQAASSWALCSIASDLRNCMHIVDAGAVWPLLRLLRQCHDSLIVYDDSDDVKQEHISKDYASCKEAIASLLQNIGHYELRQAGVTLQHLRDAGVTVSVLAIKQRLEGATACQLAKDGFDYWEIRESGYSLMRSLILPGEYQEDAICAVAVLLRGSNCDNRTFRAMLEAELLGGIKNILHNSKANKFQNSTDLHRIKLKAIELIPLLVAKGVSCPALLVHAGVMPPLLQMLAQPDDIYMDKCLAAHALGSLSTAEVSKSEPTRNNTPHSGLETVREKDALDDHDREDEESYHEIIIKMGALRILSDMVRHHLAICRQSAVVALRTILRSSATYCDNRRIAGPHSVHSFQQKILKDFFCSDREAVDALLRELRVGIDHLKMDGSTENIFTNKDSHLYQSEEECPVSACIDILYILVAHTEAKTVLSDAGIVLPFLRLIHKEVSSSPSKPPLPIDPKHLNHDGGNNFLGFCSLPRLGQLVTLLRHLTWYNTPNIILILENEGIELLTQCIQPNILSDVKRADALWILHGAIPHGATVMLAVGAIEEVLNIVFGNRQCHEENISGAVLEAALSILSEIIQLDNGIFFLRVVALAAKANLGFSPVTTHGNEGANAPMVMNAKALIAQLRHLSMSDMCRGTCRSIAMSTLFTMEVLDNRYNEVIEDKN